MPEFLANNTITLSIPKDWKKPKYRVGQQVKTNRIGKFNEYATVYGLYWRPDYEEWFYCLGDRTAINQQNGIKCVTEFLRECPEEELNFMEEQ